jgi:hypothetical protein
LKAGVCPRCEIPLPIGYIRCPRCDVEVDSPQSVPEAHAAPSQVEKKTATQKFRSPTQRFRTPTQRFSTGTQRFATGRSTARRTMTPTHFVLTGMVFLLAIAFVVLMSTRSAPPVTKAPAQVDAPVAIQPPDVSAAEWARAREKFKSAQALADQDRIADALPLAEESRSIYLELQKKCGRDVEAELRKVDELIAFCKRPPAPPPTAVSMPAPAPIEKPAAVKPPEPEPFKPADPPKPAPASTWFSKSPAALRADPSPVAHSIAALLAAHLPNSAEDQAVMTLYTERFLKSELDHEEAARYLLVALAKAKKDNVALPACRLMALGHLEALSAAKRESLLAVYGNDLDLAEAKALEVLRGMLAKSTPEAFERALQDETASKSTRGVFWMLRLLDKPDEQYVVLAKATEFISKLPASRWASFKAILVAAKPCSRCKGTHEVPCDFGCDSKGEVAKRCPTCNGSGKMPFSTSQAPCPEKRPGPHLWTEKCPKCNGTRAQPCRSCKAPWQPIPTSAFIIEKCEACSGSGVVHPEMKTPCPVCGGAGRSIAPAK